MAIMGVTSLLPRKTTILPEGGRDFLHRRMMELVGVGVGRGRRRVAARAVHLQPGRSLAPIMRRAARRTYIVGLPGAYISDLLLQTFGLAIVLVPVA